MAVNGDISTNVIRKTKPDAILPPEQAPRKPLKFWPVIVGDEGSSSDELAFAPAFPSLADVDDKMANSAATYGMVVEVLDASVALISERVAPLRVKLAGMEVENANLRGTIAELKAQVSELAFVSERLRIERRGPVGPRGVRGVDGRDGVGLAGPEGKRGPKGDAAPSITGWLIHPDTFEVQPMLSDGTKGAVLHMRPLFEVFNDAIVAADIAEEIDDAAGKRAEAERQRELSRWSK